MIFNRASRDLDIVERDGVIAELLIIFVALARNQNNVARSGQRNSAIDCLRAIDDFFIAIRTKSFFDLRDDCVWVFLSRIIGRNDGVVGKAIYHLSHQRAFLPVAIAPAAENGNQSLRLEFAQSFRSEERRVGKECGSWLSP